MALCGLVHSLNLSVMCINTLSLSDCLCAGNVKTANDNSQPVQTGCQLPYLAGQSKVKGSITTCVRGIKVNTRCLEQEPTAKVAGREERRRQRMRSFLTAFILCFT